MNEEIITNEEEVSDDYLEVLESVPAEVRRFMWSEAFTLIIKTIAKAYKLTDGQKEVLRRVTTQILTNTDTPVLTRTQFADIGITGENQENILKSIEEEIVSRALVQIVKYDDEIELTEEALYETGGADHIASTASLEAPSPAQTISIIAERLSKPASITPTKRDLSTPPPKSDLGVNDLGIKAIDPYRELPLD
jgi:hypothetical protein